MTTTTTTTTPKFRIPTASVLDEVRSPITATASSSTTTTKSALKTPQNQMLLSRFGGGLDLTPSASHPRHAVILLQQQQQQTHSATRPTPEVRDTRGNDANLLKDLSDGDGWIVVYGFPPTLDSISSVLAFVRDRVGDLHPSSANYQYEPNTNYCYVHLANPADARRALHYSNKVVEMRGAKIMLGVALVDQPPPPPTSSGSHAVTAPSAAAATFWDKVKLWIFDI